MERCPNCKARVTDSLDCRRCGMDLRLLLETEAAAEAWLCRALRLIADGDLAPASDALQRAQTLHHNPLASLLLRLCRARVTS